MMPLAIIAGAIAFLLVLVLRFRLPAFLALLICSMVAGLALGMPPADLLASVQQGMGGTLGFVAVVVGLGAMLGALLELSGGITALAEGMLRRFPERLSRPALGAVGIIIAIPVFFDVALIILAPILFALSRKTGRATVGFAIPLLAGLAVGHGFIPPTPGPIAVAQLIGANLGFAIIAGLATGIPAMIIGGPLFVRLMGFDRMEARAEAAPTDGESTASARGFGLALAVVLLPLALMICGIALPYFVAEDSPVIPVAGFVGNPFTALTLAVLAAYFIYGRARDVPRDKLHDVLVKALEPAGIIILVTGAGGVFKQVLVDSGAGSAFAATLTAGGMPILLFAFLVAGIVRVSQGSATVAMVTAAGLTAPLVPFADPSPMQLALLVSATAAGATLASHVNDSGFWLVNRYLGQTEAETLRSWTLSSTIVGLSGFAMAALIWPFV